VSQRILIIEDHRETARDFQSIVLRAMGGTVDIASDGAEGVAKAEEMHPDVVVLDIDLPILDGFEVLEQLKERQIPTRVIMLSGIYIDIESAVKAIKAGACDYLVKPVDPDKVVNHIKKALITESTINLRMASDIPPLTRELLSRLERRLGSKNTDTAADQPGLSRNDSFSFREKIFQHWLIILVTIAVAIAGVTWAVMKTLYVTPRDFEIERLRSMTPVNPSEVKGGKR
jgi:DNA-binding response OmpR family regulator